MKKEEKKNKKTIEMMKAFSLVELVVVMVIASIISVSLLWLFSTMIKEFNKKTIESEIMIECQSIKNNIMESLKENISYTYYTIKEDSNEESDEEENADEIEENDEEENLAGDIEEGNEETEDIKVDENVSKAILEVNVAKGTNEFWYYYIFDFEKQTVYLESYDENQGDLNNKSDFNTIFESKKEKDFLGKYINGFTISPLKLDKERKTNAQRITCAMSFEYMNVNYEISEQVRPRNGY